MELSFHSAARGKTFLALARFDNGVCHRAGYKLDSADSVIVAGNDIVYLVGIAVGIDDSDDGYVELTRFEHGVVLFFRVDDEQCAGKSAHILDAAEVLFEFVALGFELEHFLFGKERKLVHFFHKVDLIKALYTRTYRLEIGERAAQPTRLNIIHAALLRFLRDSFLRLLLRADEKYRLALRRDVLDKGIRLVYHLDRLFEVDDVDVVTRDVDILFHFGIPLARGMSEMNARFEKLFHRDDICHGFLRFTAPTLRSHEKI